MKSEKNIDRRCAVCEDINPRLRLNGQVYCERHSKWKEPNDLCQLFLRRLGPARLE